MFSSIYFPCAKNMTSLLLRKSCALENKRARKLFLFACVKVSKSLVLCQILPLTGSKNVSLKRNKRSFHAGAHTLVSPTTVCVPKAKTKDLWSFGEANGWLHIWAAKSGKLLNKSGFLNSLFSKTLAGLIQNLKCYRFLLEKTRPPPHSPLLGQKQCFHDVKRSLLSAISEESQNNTGRSKTMFVGRSNIFY